LGDQIVEGALRVCNALVFEHRLRGGGRLLDVGRGLEGRAHDDRRADRVQDQRHYQHDPVLQGEGHDRRYDHARHANHDEHQARTAGFGHVVTAVILNSAIDIEVGSVDCLIADGVTQFVDKGALGPVAGLCLLHDPVLPGIRA
jgi:hypothetical protein